MSLFKWTYRRLQERIEDGPKDVKERYDLFVKDCFERTQNDDISSEEDSKLDHSKELDQTDEFNLERNDHGQYILITIIIMMLIIITIFKCIIEY